MCPKNSKNSRPATISWQGLSATWRIRPASQALPARPTRTQSCGWSGNEARCQGDPCDWRNETASPDGIDDQRCFDGVPVAMTYECDKESSSARLRRLLTFVGQDPGNLALRKDAIR